MFDNASITCGLSMLGGARHLRLTLRYPSGKVPVDLLGRKVTYRTLEEKDEDREEGWRRILFTEAAEGQYFHSSSVGECSYYVAMFKLSQKELQWLPSIRMRRLCRLIQRGETFVQAAFKCAPSHPPKENPSVGQDQLLPPVPSDTRTGDPGRVSSQTLEFRLLVEMLNEELERLCSAGLYIAVGQPVPGNALWASVALPLEISESEKGETDWTRSS